VVDSSKSPDRAELLGKSKNIKPVIVHLVRDGKAVTWSYMRKYKKVLSFMWRWFSSNIKTEIIKRRNNFDYIFIRYEDLVRNPKKTVKKILFKVGLKYESGMVDFRNFTHHEIGGNRMRFKKSNVLFNLLFGWLNLYYKHKK